MGIIERLLATMSYTVPRHNHINVIHPYKDKDIWMFDDPSVGLKREALVEGMPEMILLGCKALSIDEPDKGFTVLFSGNPWPGAKIVLDWVREQEHGNVYIARQLGDQQGWLCPALFKYFEYTPARIYIDLKPIEAVPVDKPVVTEAKPQYVG